MSNLLFNLLASYILHSLLPYRIRLFSWLHTVGLHSSGQYPVGPLCSSRQQPVRNAVQTFLESVRLERVCRPSAWPTCSCNGAWSSQVVSHLSTIQAQCCLTSVFEWGLVFPKWHGPHFVLYSLSF